MLHRSRARLAVLLVALAALAASARAQLTATGLYSGFLDNAGTLPMFVEVTPIRAQLYVLDLGNRLVEIAEVPLDAAGRGSAISNRGLSVTVAPFADSVGATIVGTVGRLSYYLRRADSPGAYSLRNYTGTFYDSIGTVLIGRLLLLPSGRCFVLAFNDAGWLGAYGERAGDRVFLATTGGSAVQLNLAPVNGVLSGTAQLFGPVSSYLLVERQRAPVVNLATRGTVGPGQSLTAGFVIGGVKTLLIRAIGPTLGAFGVAGAQSDPSLTLYRGTQILVQNDNWAHASAPAAAAHAGAFALPVGSRDAVLLVTLETGAYTATVTGTGPAGDALVEVYEID